MRARRAVLHGDPPRGLRGAPALRPGARVGDVRAAPLPGQRRRRGRGRAHRLRRRRRLRGLARPRSSRAPTAAAAGRARRRRTRASSTATSSSTRAARRRSTPARSQTARPGSTAPATAARRGRCARRSRPTASRPSPPGTSAGAALVACGTRLLRTSDAGLTWQERADPLHGAHAPDRRARRARSSPTGRRTSSRASTAARRGPPSELRFPAPA